MLNFILKDNLTLTGKPAKWAGLFVMETTSVSLREFSQKKTR